MTKAQSLALKAGRDKRSERVTRRTMIQREILNLRGQVASEIAKSKHAAGINLHLGDIDEEYVPDLKTLKSRTRVFERMANDPQVRGQLRAITMTIASSVVFKASGGTQARRDLLAANILNDGPRKLWCSSSWLDRLYESFGCLIYGFTLFGKTRRVVDGKMIYSDLSWLHPRSVDDNGWIMNEVDELQEVRRTYTDAKGVPHTMEPIPASELFLMTWDRRGPNWEGNAFIRPMYRPWMLGEMAEKIDIIDLQNRGVGIPVATLSGAGGQKERDTLVEILKSMRGGSKERAFIVLEKDEEVKYLTSEGQAKDAIPTLQHHRSNIVKAAGTEYFEQGNTATGSRAGASALASGFFIEVNAIVKHIVDMINFGVGTMPGLAQELQDLNFDDDDDYAIITASSVSPTEQLDNVPLMLEAVAKGAVPPNIKHANHLATLLNWPTLTKAEYEAAQEAMTSLSPAFGGAGRPTEAGPDEQGRDDREGRRLGMAEKKTLLSGGIPPMRSPAWHWLR